MSIDLNAVWFLLVGALLTGYAVLDGFDLGVGALHLFARTDKERRLMINSIGPVWDGNEVWLVTGGGALFAAFPQVYATVFSGFYIAFMLLLFALIFRAVSIEFRGKLEAEGWRKVWDVGFSAGSVLAAVLAGVALGNIARGIPLDAQGRFAGSFLGLLHPYALLVGVTTLSLFMMHGAIYITMKTDQELQSRSRIWARSSAVFFLLCYGAVTLATLFGVPHMVQPFRELPVLLPIPLLTLLAAANILRELRRGREVRAFASSAAVIVGLMALFGIGMFPNMVLSDPLPEHSLTIYNAASSPKTLRIMLVIALIGMPLAVAYTAGIYWIFRGKVKLDESSY